MFNPLYPFTPEVLEATVAKGCTWFVRNSYPFAFDHFDVNNKAAFLITHYNDAAKAKTHVNSIVNDVHRRFYDYEKEADRERLLIAANQPTGYRIYSAYFLPNYKRKISSQTKEKINRYLFRHTSWKPGRGDTVKVDFFLQFGMLYATLRFDGQEIKITFEEIVNQD